MPAQASAIDVCAAGVDSRLFTSLVRQESNFNPYAIGLDGKAVLKTQPKSYEEAVKTAVNLAREGKGFSVGLAQVHISNVVRYGMTWEQAFDPCMNLRVGSAIYRNFYAQAIKAGYRADGATFAALRGFNSGSVHNPVSNGYARDILGRVGIPSAAFSAIPAIDASRDVAAAEPITQVAKEDASSPSMFSAPSQSLFGDAGEVPRSFPVVAPTTVRVEARRPVTDDAGPVVLRATFAR